MNEDLVKALDESDYIQIGTLEAIYVNPHQTPYSWATDVDIQVVFLYSINNRCSLVFRGQCASVAHFASHLGIEGGLVEDNLDRKSVV